MHESDQLVFRSLLRRVSAFMFFSTRHIMSYHPTGITQHWRWQWVARFAARRQSTKVVSSALPLGSSPMSRRTKFSWLDGELSIISDATAFVLHFQGFFGCLSIIAQTERCLGF